ncbi:MAG: long-chain fatty acid--CoA ligase [Bacteroidota bacterium]|nr:long-chain fatty acid--CoA ligase [Rhodothermia bacterium]MCS7155115.1 long-chain fatty acid--CoA ligase [Bacteroidota bacterium]MDW8138776.1 long-chain fatty acid--CoA ligase [Bacteroidota bacterium]MDW8286429.1 long-chain fatty acid--CoA ligase [Bacteroidota bacterium]
MPTSTIAFRTVSEMLLRQAERYAGRNKPALWYKDRARGEYVPISWERFWEQAQAMAGYLASQGVTKGDRVALLMENRPEWAITDFGMQLLGAVNVSLYTTIPAGQVEYILKDSGAKVLVVSTSLQLGKALKVFEACPELRQIVSLTLEAEGLPPYVKPWEQALAEGRAYWQTHPELWEAWRAVSEEDLCSLIYTSGTTGLPKGVMLTHRNFCSNVQAALQVIDIYESDRTLSFLPLSHSFERTAGYLAVLAGGAEIAYAESLDTIARNLQEVRPTVVTTVPRLLERIYVLVHKAVEEGPALRRRIFYWALEVGRQLRQALWEGRSPSAWLRAQYALAHRLVFARLHERTGGRLRFFVSGGAALPKEVGEFFAYAGIPIIEGYGLTETAPVLTVNPLDRPRFGTVGWPLPGVTLAIQSLQDGRILCQLRGEDYPGALALSSEEGEILAKGPNVMRGYWNLPEETAKVFDAEGWFHTGDVGRFEQGYLRITDRIKHMIVSKGGKNIYPGPIEELLKSSPYVDQVVVIGEGREFLTALIVPNFEALKPWAQQRGLACESEQELVALPEVQRLMESEVRRLMRDLPAHERVRRFRLLGSPFTIESGELTPTLKVRRKVIEEKYRALIEAMYEEVLS